MGFIDSYKRLEKLCSEMYGDNRGLSAYIDEMTSKTCGSYCIPGWSEDLKWLKRYRWVRNQIAHEPGCTEKNMCVYSDAKWLDDFYSRIINQTDPLTLYAKATKPCKPAGTKKPSKSTAAKKPSKSTQTKHTYKRKTTTGKRRRQNAAKKKAHKHIGWLAFLISALLVAAAVYLYLEFGPPIGTYLSKTPLHMG